MYLDWTKHLETTEEKERFEAMIKSASPVLDRLADLISEKLLSLENSNLELKQYLKPNWAYETAHKNGMASAYNAVRNLVTIKDQ